jgi:hypothetical protein
MSVSTNGWTQAQYLAAAPLVGLYPSGFVPASLQSLAATVAQQNEPAGAPDDWVLVCTASLIARGLIYFKSNPGDCGTPTQYQLGTAQQITLGIANGAASALPGIGAAVQVLQQIFANHEAAIATEQTTICKVTLLINQVIPYYDNQVRIGAISPSSAYLGMQSFLQQANGLLSQIEKKCDAACVYEGILAAHSQFVQIYYPAIAPPQASAHAPGAPPAAYGTAPGGVVLVGAGSYPASVSSPAPGTVPRPAVVNAALSSNNLLFAGVAAAIVLVLVFAGKP